MAKLPEKMIKEIPFSKIKLDIENQFISLSKKELLEKLDIDEDGNFTINGEIYGVNRTEFELLRQKVENLQSTT